MATCPRCSLAEAVPVGKQWACTKCGAQLFWDSCGGCDTQNEVWLPGWGWRCKPCERWNWSTWRVDTKCGKCRRAQTVPGFPSRHGCVNSECKADFKRLTSAKCRKATVLWVTGKVRPWKCSGYHTKRSDVIALGLPLNCG